MSRKNILAVGSLLVVILLASGCGAAGRLVKKARLNYQRGDYDSAFFNCAASLRIDPNNSDAQTLIQDSFRAADNKHNNTIKGLKSSSDKFKWDDIFSGYEALIKINNEIGSLPTLMNKDTRAIIKFDIADYTQDLGNARNNAAEAHYQQGMYLSEKEGRDAMKQAAKEFKTAERFVSGYKDSAEMYEKCRKAGIKRIAIIPFIDKSGKKGKYGAMPEMMVDLIVSNVMNDKESMEFLEVISRDQLEHVLDEQDLGAVGILDPETIVMVGKILGVHEILTGKITQIIYTPDRKTDRRIKERERVVIGKEDYTDKNGNVKQRNVMGDVFANVRIFTKVSSASIVGSYQSIDVQTAKVNKMDNFVGRGEFRHEWATYNGDARALNKKTKKLVNTSEEFSPVEEEMVRKALINLSNSLAQKLKEYVR